MNTEPARADFPDRTKLSTTEPVFPTPYLKFGAFYLDTKRRALFQNANRIKLQEKVYLALTALLQNRGDVVTREHMKTCLWPRETHVNFDASVNTAVNKLRHVLADSSEAPAYIETIPKKGYRFIAEVEFVSQPPALRPAGFPAKEPAEEAAEVASPPQPESQPTDHSKLLFAASLIALFLASLLFGAAVRLFLH